MLTLTDNAVRAIRSLTTQPGQPADSGLRIMSSGDGAAPLHLSLAPNPMAGDEVVESDGARVFMEPTAAGVLTDKALDAEVDEDGGVAFSLAESAG